MATRRRSGRERWAATYAIACAALGALALLPARADAFSSPAAYKDAPLEGGGGGRYFTGSPADGYGCDVCHEGAQGEPLQVAGLPLDGYELGASYEVTIAWPAQVEHVSLLAEIVDESRHTAGMLALPRFDAWGPEELCSGDQEGFPAAELITDEEQGRAFVSSVDCGAKRVRFLWTAPTQRAGTLWVSAGFVSSNDDAAPSGDGVTMISLPMARAGTTLSTREIATGCAVSSVGGELTVSHARYVLGLGLLTIVLYGRRRSPRAFTAGAP